MQDILYTLVEHYRKSWKLIPFLGKIDYEKSLIQRLLDAKEGALGANLVGPLFFVLFFADSVPTYFLFLFSVLQITTFMIRMSIADRALSEWDTIDKEKANSYLKQYLLTIFANSMLWGSATFFVFYYADKEAVFVLLVAFFALVSAATQSLGVIYHAFFIFTINLLLPLVLCTFILGDETFFYFLGISVFVFLLFILPVSFQTYHAFLDNVRKKEEIGALNNSLQTIIETLKQKNSNFQSLFDMMMEGIVVSDENRRIIDVNQAALKMFAINNKDEAIGTYVLEYVAPFEIEKVKESFRQEIAAAQELTLLKKDGTSMSAIAGGRNMFLNGTKVRLTSVLDITEIKEKDRQLALQSRLAQMGELLNMIAHQWRQPLAAITATTTAMKMRLMLDKFDEASFTKELEQIEAFAQHLSRTIDDFRDFYKEDKITYKVSLAEITKEVLNIVRASFQSKNITLQTDFSCNETIETYANEIKQVLLNLLKNAEEVLLEREVSEPSIVIETACNDAGHILRVRDNAGGIADEIQEKIFEPYFSTKNEQGGTGLGLYMSKKIIESHCQGKLHVYNDDKGAVFEITLSHEMC